MTDREIPDLLKHLSPDEPLWEEDDDPEDSRDFYSMLLNRCGYVEDGAQSAEGSAQNDLTAERADTVMAFIALAKGSMLPRKLLPVDPRPAVDGDALRERAEDLWSLLDWTLWGHGLGDVLRERMADTMLAALPAADLDQALQLMQAWKERRGYPVMHEQFAQLRAEVERLTRERDDARCELAAINAKVIELHEELLRENPWFPSQFRPPVGSDTAPVHGVTTPGVVDGDVLSDLLADMMPPEWRTDAAREHAEKTLAEIHRVGVTVLRGPQSQPWTPEVDRQLLDSDIDSEFVRAAHRLVHAAGSMRDHWAEANDGSTGGRARRQELWRNLHAQADDLSEVLPDWVPASDAVDPDIETAAREACQRLDCDTCNDFPEPPAGWEDTNTTTATPSIADGLPGRNFVWLRDLIRKAEERGELPCPGDGLQCITADGHWYHGDCTRAAEQIGDES